MTALRIRCGIFGRTTTNLKVLVKSQKMGSTVTAIHCQAIQIKVRLVCESLNASRSWSTIRSLDCILDERSTRGSAVIVESLHKHRRIGASGEQFHGSRTFSCHGGGIDFLCKILRADFQFTLKGTRLSSDGCSEDKEGIEGLHDFQRNSWFSGCGDAVLFVLANRKQWPAGFDL